MRYIVALFLGLLLLSGVSFSLTNVIGCMNITSSDYYILNNDLVGANITVYGGGQRACLRVAANDVVIDCDGYSITNNGAVFASGIQVDGVTTTQYDNITIMNCPNVSGYTNSGLYVDYTENSTIRNVTSYGNTQNGFYFDESHNNNISNCTAYNNNNRGFLIWNSDSNNVSWSNSYNNALRGFELYYSQYNRFESCNAYDTAATQDYGFYFNTDCDYAYLLNTTSVGHLNSGYYIGGSSQQYININDSVAQDNAQYGFQFGSTYWMNMSNNTASNNGLDGFHIDTPYYLLFNFNKAFGNGQYGWWSNRPWTDNASNNILYNNSAAELNFASTTTIRFRIYNLTIDNPSGGFQNYSTLDIDDRIYNGEAMTIRWDTNSSALPAGRGSFEEKTVNITLSPSTAFIENIFFRWDEPSTAGYNEMTFELWEYNSSGWTYRNAALGEIKNFLYYYRLFTSGEYTILEGVRDRNCTYINASGTYSLSGNAVGEGYSINDFDTEYACILISSDDVIFDCNGYNISNEHVVYDNNFAIFVNGTPSNAYSNITIRNCPNISEYDGGITFEYSNGNNVSGVVIDANGQSASNGVVLYSSNYSSINNVQAYNMWFYGIQMLMGSANNNISDCLVDTAESGYYALHSGTSNNVFRNNTARYCTNSGFRMLSTASSNTYVDNIAHDNSYGFSVEGAYLQFMNNTAYSNNDGFGITSAENSTFSDNEVFDNSNAGISVSSSNNLSFSGSSVHGIAPNGGFRITNSELSLTNPHFFNTSGVGLFIQAIGTNSNLSLINATFDSPSGLFQNYTALNLNDIVDAGSSYYLNWDSQPAVLPQDYVSFAGKYVEISTASGAVSIDSITWNWLDSELPGYNESAFELLVYNSSGWAILNNTPDTLNNLLSLSTLNPSSTFGILQLNDTGAPQIALNEPVNNYATNTTAVNFNFTATDNHATSMNCSLFINDTFNLSTMASNNTLTNIAASIGEGSWNWSILCRDGFNNSNTSQVRDFIVDLTLPFVNITDPSNITYPISVIPLNFVATDASGINSCWYTLNGGAPTAIPGCLNTTITLPNGFYDFILFASDNAGNINSSNVSFTVSAPSPPSGGSGTEESVPRGSVATSVSPEGELTVTVTYRGAPVEDADVDLYIYSPRFEFLESALTDSDGEAIFTLTESGTYRIYVSASGLRFSNPYVVIYEMSLQCLSNSDCANNEACSSGSCIGVSGTCGYVSDHAWNEYACCSDSDCGVGFSCSENNCVLETASQEDVCTLDSDCSNIEFCDNGDCKPVQRGTCGYVAEHAWFDYECCSDLDCHDNMLCMENQCIILEEFSIETEKTGFVGDEHRIKVFRKGEPFIGGTVIIISPEGTEFIRIADDEGGVVLPLEIEGDYEVRLIFENAVVDSADIDSNVKPVVQEDEKPYVFFEELMKACPFVILLLVVIGILYVLYRRRKREKFESIKKT